MKIGILTHPLRTNYGGVLQNYALQKTLSNLGHDVLTIDRHNDKSKTYKFFSFLKRNIEHYLLGKRDIPTTYHINLSRKQFLFISQNIQNFIKENIKCTHYISSQQKLKESLQYDFDAYIVGSDQIWRKEYAPNSYLDFLGDKKVFRIAYAASFGHGYWTYSKPLTEKCRALVKNFDAVSVREKSAVSLCKTNLGIESHHVLDPTMLLTKDDYKHLINEDDEINPESLMTYLLDDTPEKRSIVNTLLKEYNLERYEVKPKHKVLTKNINIEDMIVPPISLWLKGFRDAKYVVTDSFHGTVFSLLFNKQFFVFANKLRGLDRFTSLLSDLGLLDRIFYSEEDFIERYERLTVIDYERVNSIIDLKRNKSLTFLSKSLTTLE